MPGSGLGLAIVQQVVDGHGGSITLANRPGGGAVATLTLPAWTEGEPVPPAPDLQTHPAPQEDQPVPMPVEESLFR